MSHLYPFPLQNFEAYCNSLDRVGIDPGYVMYTNHHASNGKPAARLVSSEQLPTAKAYIANQTDEHFKSLVELGAMFDTEWDRKPNIGKLSRIKAGKFCIPPLITCM